MRFATAACMQKYGNVSFATVACAKCMRYGGGGPIPWGGGVATRDTEPYIRIFTYIYIYTYIEAPKNRWLMVAKYFATCSLVL